jgi:hypothetical protein
MWDLTGALGDVNTVLGAAAAVIVAITIFSLTRKGVNKAA